MAAVFGRVGCWQMQESVCPLIQKVKIESDAPAEQRKEEFAQEGVIHGGAIVAPEVVANVNEVPHFPTQASRSFAIVRGSPSQGGGIGLEGFWRIGNQIAEMLL